MARPKWVRAPAELAQLLLRAERRRDREVGARIAQRAEQHVLEQEERHVREQQRDHDLAHPQPQLQHQRDADPHGPGQGGGQQHERQAQTRRADIVHGQRRGGDGTQPELPFNADVPETDPERHGGAQADQHQRDGGGDGLGETVGGEEHLDHQLLGQERCGHAGEDQHEGGQQQADRQRAREARRRHGRRYHRTTLQREAVKHGRASGRRSPRATDRRRARPRSGLGSSPGPGRTAPAPPRDPR